MTKKTSNKTTTNKKSSKNLFDKIGSLDSKSKKEIINSDYVPSNEDENDKNSIGRQVEDMVIHYDIDYENDSSYLIAIKEAINKSKITKREVYDMFGRTDGYNLYYSLKKGVISFEKAERWARAMGKELVIEFIDKED